MPPGIIPPSQRSGIMSQAIVDKFDELQEIKVNNLFRSFFRTIESPVMYPTIDVRRGTERVAPDVFLGHQGISTQISKYTQKAFDLFYFKLKTNASLLEPYYRVFNTSGFSLEDAANLASEIATNMKANTDMIERSVEIFCSQVFESGVVRSVNPDTQDAYVDFKRRAESIVDLGGGNYWDLDSVDPNTGILQIYNMMKQYGKTGASVINCMFGEAAWRAYRNNKIIASRWNQFNNKRDMLAPAQMTANGGIYQGEMDCDNIKIRIFTYNDRYDDPLNSNTSTAYMKSNKVYLIAEDAKLDLLYGAIPQVKGAGGGTLTPGQLVFKNFVNEEENYDIHTVESRPLPVPVTLDRLGTLTVVGA